ncbi:ESX secretion-associated protein EspG, partial [Nocardia farcinica]|uniref:ESX secretion-associated protein EspG n=1 Tax=Nocardia farcinica TaxID=37329 RepID=UPI00313E875D
MLGGVTLALDEMQFLLEKLEFDELPVVLQAVGRYDNQADHDAAMQVAENSLVERDLLIDGVVHRELEDRLRTLYRPHWVLALRLVVEGQVSRMCLARGAQQSGVGPGVTITRTGEHAVISPSMAANGAGRVAWVSGNATADVTVTPEGEV